MDSEQPTTSMAPMETTANQPEGHEDQHEGIAGQPEATANQPKQQGTAKRFVVTNSEAKELWASDVVNICTICRNGLMDPCLECQFDAEMKGDCYIAWGVCKHVFHEHCIAHWIKTQKSCPLDRTSWAYEKYVKYKEDEEEI